jgi:hypothetical protein
MQHIHSNCTHFSSITMLRTIANCVCMAMYMCASSRSTTILFDQQQANYYYSIISRYYYNYYYYYYYYYYSIILILCHDRWELKKQIMPNVCCMCVQK